MAGNLKNRNGDSTLMDSTIVDSTSMDATHLDSTNDTLWLLGFLPIDVDVLPYGARTYVPVRCCVHHALNATVWSLLVVVS